MSDHPALPPDTTANGMTRARLVDTHLDASPEGAAAAQSLLDAHAGLNDLHLGPLAPRGWYRAPEPNGQLAWWDGLAWSTLRKPYTRPSDVFTEQQDHTEEIARVQRHCTIRSGADDAT